MAMARSTNLQTACSVDVRRQLAWPCATSPVTLFLHPGFYSSRYGMLGLSSNTATVRLAERAAFLFTSAGYLTVATASHLCRERNLM